MENLSNENIVHVKDNGVEYIQFRKLLEYKNILTHAYTLKTNLNFGGNGEYVENRERTKASTEKICKVLNIEYNNIIRPFEMHFNRVIYTDKKPNYSEELVFSKEYIGVDGLITDKKNIAFLLTSSDCTPVFLFDPVKKVIANVHSGWQGTFLKIAYVAVKKMVNEKGCNPKDIIACIGPSIRSCHFEVHRDLQVKCYDLFNYTGRIDEIIKPIGIVDGREKWVIDSVLINKIILEEAGLKPENIIDSKICTVCNSKSFYSYRMEKKYANNAAIICLK